jgi:hypothetical protein
MHRAATRRRSVRLRESERQVSWAVASQCGVISIASGRPPEVDRPEGSATLFLPFRGTRDAKVRDRDTRVRIALRAHWRAVCGVCSASG